MAETKSRPIKCIHIAQLAERASPPALVKGLLLAGASSVFFGPPKTRKSFVMLDLAMHVALGRPWCGRQVSQGDAVYVVAEGWHGINQRVEAWCRHHGIERTAASLYIMQPVKIGATAGGKTVKDDVDGILAAIETLGITPKLIVLDTLARTMIGDENSTREMGNYVARVDTLRVKTQAHVAIVHHTGWNETRIRGARALQGAVDTECPIVREEDLTVVGTPIQRDLPEGFKQTFEFEQVVVGEDEDGDDVTSLVPVPSDREPTGEGDTQYAKALKVLRKLCARNRNKNDGRIAEAPDHWFMALVEDWRKACAELPLSKGGKRAQNIAFKRSFAKLKEDGEITVSGDDAWVTAAWKGGGHDERNPPPIEGPGDEIPF